MKKLFIILFIFTTTSIFSQGNFTTEWESPVGWSYHSLAKLEVSSNVLSIILLDLDSSNTKSNVRIYDGESHELSYSWTLSSVGSFGYNSIFGVQHGTSFYSNQFDVNGDGKNEIIHLEINGRKSIVDPTNGNVLYSHMSSLFMIIDIDADGFLEILVSRSGDSGIKIISTPAQTVSINNHNQIVKDYNLKQNYPNPFNPTTTIEYNLNKNSDVKIIIYDILGKEVNTLVNQKQIPGLYKLNLNASELSSGTYF